MDTTQSLRTCRLSDFKTTLADRIIVIDGAGGTVFQDHALVEDNFRGERFSNTGIDLRGNFDILNLTEPSLVSSVHESYIKAGADIITTNTFSSTQIAQSEYQMDEHVQEMNYVGASLAYEVVRRAEERDGRVRWVAGSLGPTNKTASMASDVNNPGQRDVSFNELKSAYEMAALGLLEGGVDILLLETITDTLNAKAAIVGIENAKNKIGLAAEIAPLIISGTVIDQSGRTLSGQTLQAFWISLRHANAVAFGLNCSLGHSGMKRHIAELSRLIPVPTIAYPNAGLPNEFGEYDESPEEMSGALKEWAEESLLNIVGSCCGSNPEHTKAIVDAVRGLKPRPLAAENLSSLSLAGLDVLHI